MQFDLMHLWGQMGWVAKGVALTLLIMAILCLVVTIERVLVFNRATRQSLSLAERLGALLGEGQVDAAIGLADDKSFKTSYLGPIVKQGLTAFLTRFNQPGVDAIDAAKRQIEKAIQLEQLALRRGISILATTASTAPFVGLFGTVMGIINAFQGMGASGGAGGIAAVSVGIAEALVTTAFGLLVAIPATWVFNYLLGRIETMSTEMTVSTTELLDFCITQVEQRAA